MTDLVQAQWSNKIASLFSQKIGEVIGLIEDSDHLLRGDVIRLLRGQGWGITNVSSPFELRQAYEQDVSLLQVDIAKRVYVLSFWIALHCSACSCRPDKKSKRTSRAALPPSYPHQVTSLYCGVGRIDLRHCNTGFPQRSLKSQRSLPIGFARCPMLDVL